MVEPRTASRPLRSRPAGKWTGGKYTPKRKVCSFCASKSNGIDYKDTSMLTRFISDRGKIEPRRRSGTCNKHQHALALAIKRARHLALLPFVPEHIHKMGIVAPLNLAPAVEAKPVAETPAASPPETEAETKT